MNDSTDLTTAGLTPREQAILKLELAQQFTSALPPLVAQYVQQYLVSAGRQASTRLHSTDKHIMLCKFARFLTRQQETGFLTLQQQIITDQWYYSLANYQYNHSIFVLHGILANLSLDNK